MTVKDKIIDLRIRSGLTQEQFAEKANIDLDRLKAVENGDLLPDEDMRVAISQAFELSAHELTPDIEDQEEYDRQSEVENTIDTQLPYNPFFREGSEGTVGTSSQPMVANSRKILRNAGIDTFFAPVLFTGLFALIPFFFSTLFIRTHLMTTAGNAVVFTAIISAVSPVISLLFARYFYLKAFKKLGKEEPAKKIIWFAIMAVNEVPGLASYSLSQLVSKPSKINDEIMLNLSGYYKEAAIYFALLTLSIVLTLVTTVSVFYLLGKLLDETPKVENENRFFIPYILITAGSVVRYVLAIVTGSYSSIIDPIRISVEIVSIVFVLYLIKNKQKLHDELLTKIIPIIVLVLIVVLTIISSVIKIINR